jgi:hypothetical protein
MKLRVMQFSPTSCHFNPLWSKYSSQHLVQKHPHSEHNKNKKKKKKLHGLSPQANYTDRATAACRRRDCQLLRIKSARSQRDGSLRPYSRFSRQEQLLFYQVAPQLYSTRLSGPRSRPTTFFWLCRESNPGLRICSKEL